MTNHISCTCPACCPEKWALNATNYQQRRAKMTQEERDAEDKALGESLQSGLNDMPISNGTTGGQFVPNNIEELFDRFREQDKSK